MDIKTFAKHTLVSFQLRLDFLLFDGDFFPSCLQPSGDVWLVVNYLNDPIRCDAEHIDESIDPIIVQRGLRGHGEGVIIHQVALNDGVLISPHAFLYFLATNQNSLTGAHGALSHRAELGGNGNREKPIYDLTFRRGGFTLGASIDENATEICKQLSYVRWCVRFKGEDF